MSSFQQVTLIGNLGADPITKTFEGGSQLTNLSIATTETWKDKTTGEKRENTQWHRVVLNGKLSQLADKYLQKGSKVLITGKLRTRDYVDGDGVQRFVTEIIGYEMKFMSAAPQGNSDSAVAQYQAQHSTGFTEEDHDDLPF